MTMSRRPSSSSFATESRSFFERNRERLSIRTGLPTVLIGDHHRNSPLITYPRLMIPCCTPLGPFEVGVSMTLQAQPASSPEQFHDASAVPV